jgi:putative FmdB family regulatory protein
MPTYEYACKSCDEHVEVVQSFKDEPLTTCPKCGGPLRKVFGSIGISFKGSGFYKNDTRKVPKSESSSSSSASSSSTDNGKSASSDKGGSTEKAAAPKAAAPSGDSGSGSGSSSGSGSKKAAAS